MPTFRLSLLSFLFLAAGNWGWSQSALSPEKIHRLEGLFQEINRPDRPGLAIGITVDGTPVYSRGFGMANLETGTVFSPETVSDIGSVAKQMTCMAIILLAQEGKLALNDDIRKYIPEFKGIDTVIQIQHLVHHLSGIREIYAMLALSGWRNGDGIRQGHALDLIQHATDLNYAPGEKYMYCNTAYMLLGEIITRVSGLRFEQFMQQRIFAPLGMEHTYIMDAQGEIFPSCAESYTPVLPKGWVKIYDNSTAYGQGGVYSTVPDMLRWADNFRTGKLGGTAGIAQMLERGILNSGSPISYAFGVEHVSYRGLPLIQHTGSSAGYRAALTLVPSKGVALIIKGNYATLQSASLSAAVLDILLEDSLSPAEKEAPAPPPSASTAGSWSGKLALEGTYYCQELDLLFSVGKTTDGYWFGNRRLEAIPMQRTSELELTSGHGTSIVFSKDKKGAVTGLSFSNEEILNLKMVPVPSWRNK